MLQSKIIRYVYLYNTYFLLEECCITWPRKATVDALFYYFPAIQKKKKK